MGVKRDRVHNRKLRINKVKVWVIFTRSSLKEGRSQAMIYLSP